MGKTVDRSPHIFSKSGIEVFSFAAIHRRVFYFFGLHACRSFVCSHCGRMVFWFAYLTHVNGTGRARRVFLSFKAAMADERMVVAL